MAFCKVSRWTVRNDSTANLSKITVKHSEHGGFVDESESLSLPMSATCIQFSTAVHLVGIRADESLIAFNGATTTAQLEITVALHCQPDSMQHEPCGILPDAECLPEFVATDAILAIAEHPERNHPLVQANRRIFHDGADFDGELLFALIAEPNPASLDERVLGLPASWTGYVATGPAILDSRFKSPLRIAELDNRFLECFRGSHA
jgi:hypothetical protein